MIELILVFQVKDIKPLTPGVNSRSQAVVYVLLVLAIWSVGVVNNPYPLLSGRHN